MAVVILTRDEEANLEHALASVVGWAREVFVFDSGSTDGTEAIAARHGVPFVVHPFRDYSQQRNDALRRLPIQAKWTLFLDADEQVPAELRAEIAEALQREDVDGYYVRFRLFWRNTWIRRGYFGTWLLRLFRTGRARTDDRGVNEHQLVDGKTAYLEHALLHVDRRGIARWMEKHVDYARREAERSDRGPKPPLRSLLGRQADRKDWVRWHLWQPMPPPLRALALFSKRIVLDRAFLDGPAAIEYHFYQSLWFPLLIGSLEAEREEGRGEPDHPSPKAPSP